MLLVLLGLGTWQLQRLEWKESLLQKIHEQVTAPAVPITDDPDLEYRHVNARGRFLKKEFRVGPRTDEGRAGFHVITPFKMDDGRILFVDRGFADEKTAGTMRRPSHHMQLSGIAIKPRKNFFTPDNKNGQWYWVDVAAMANDIGAKKYMTYIIADDVPEIRNNHKQYAIFWFGMAFVLVVVYILSQLRGTKQS